MRATISFDVGVEKVEQVMRALITHESAGLRRAASILDTVGSSALLEELEEVLDLLHAAEAQLRQYKDMMISFERARFETVLPSDASSPLLIDNMQKLNEAKKSMEKLDLFLEKINNRKDESDEDLEPQEG